MKKFISIAIACMFLCIAQAQKPDGMIKGVLIDTATHKLVDDATVSLLRTADTSLLAYVITDKDGSFQFKNLSINNYYIIISHQEYAQFSKLISITATEKLIDFHHLVLLHDVKTLGEVVILSEPPIVIKGDTLQFNAGRFKTKPNATVEDLLKKLPGVEVDRQGNVKSQGETIRKIYVDGKEFFGDDPRLATRNLTADMIESVQVYDDVSEQARFTKIDDGTRSKTINIKLKKDRKKGFFARTLASYGDHGHFESNASLNRFDDKERLSLIFNANNINRQGASADAGRGVVGEERGNSSGGIIRTISSGLNYNDDWNPRTSISGYYFYSKLNKVQRQGIVRQTSFADSIAALTRERSSEYNGRSHRFNFRIEYQVDSTTSILHTASLSTTNSFNNGQDTSYTLSELPSGRYLTNTGKTENSNKAQNFDLTNNLLVRKRFRKKGRTLTIGWNNSFGNNKNDGIVLSRIDFYTESGSKYNSLKQDLLNRQVSTSTNNVLSTSYTEPLGAGQILEFNYAYSQYENRSVQKTYDYNPLSGKYDTLNLSLTNNFDNSFIAHRAGVNYRFFKTKYNYQLGLAVQQSTLENKNFQALNGKDTLIHSSSLNYFPTANFNFIPGRRRNIMISYNGRTSPPSGYQLQSMLDVSDPLNIRTGNPNLKQEFNHNLDIGYNTYNVKSSRFFTVNSSFSTTRNKIVNIVDTFSRGILLIKPANLNGAYQLACNLTLGFPFKDANWIGSSINFSTNSSFDRDINLIYKRKNIGQTISISQSAALILTKEKYDFAVKAKLTYASVNYSVNRILNGKYFSQSYSADFNYTFGGNILFASEFDYYVNTGRAEGFNQKIPSWNAWISKQCFRKKNGELRFSINDILNKNQNLTRTTSDNYIEDTREIILRRYFLISFFYNVSKMGGQKKSSKEAP
jgi:hypothetical protein